MSGIEANFRRGNRPWIFAGLVVSILALGGCGGGDGKGGSRGGGGSGGSEGESREGDADAMRKEALAYREKAVAAGAEEFARSDFDQAQRFLDGAQRAFESGKDYQARSGFASARTQFSKAIENAEKAKRARQDAEVDRDAALAARKRAEDAKAAELVPDAFRSAEDQFKAAERDFNDPGRAGNAKSAFQQATDQFDRVAREAKEAEAKRNRAIVERDVVATNRKSAEDAGAKEHVPVRWEEAEQLLRDAEAAFAESRFEEAVTLYKDCSRLYLDALRNTRDVIARLKAAEESAVPEPTSPPKERPTPKETEPAEVVEGPGVAEPAPAASDPDSAIRAHIAKLFAVETNYTNGIVDLDYTQGAQLEKDCIIKVGSPNPPKFTGTEGVTSMGNLVYSFAGIGGAGRVVHKAVFEDEVEVSYDTKMELVKSGPLGTTLFRTYLMLGEKTYYAADWGVNLIVNGTQRSENKIQITPEPEFRKTPVNWFDRINVRPIVFKYAWSEPDEAGLLHVEYSDKAKNDLGTRTRLTGHVAFEWKECRFYLQSVRIRGRLSPAWVIEELGKLGVKVPQAGAAGGEGEKEKEAAGKKPDLNF
ncbi:MAG: hypothetical protein JXP34_06890 [Planctomycetes bacterium]|nr:hypothetical protein [Planctomycetota bacterium]